MTPIAYVVRLFLYLYSRQAFFTECCFISNQSEAASVLCKPIGAKLWPISEHRENWNSLSDCYLHISKYHLAYRRHSMECAEPTPTNITPIQNSKMQPASSFTFSPVQVYSTCNWGNWQIWAANHLLSQLKTKIANTILLLCYFDKICLTLTGGFWQASANLYSGGRL